MPGWGFYAVVLSVSFPPARPLLKIQNMKRLIIKWLMPKPMAIAEMAAEAIAKAINESDKTELIAKYDSYAVKLTEL